MTIEHRLESPRWRDYVLDHGKGLIEFWASCLYEEKCHLLFVLGKGFDPRMCLVHSHRSICAMRPPIVCLDYEVIFLCPTLDR
jgi:hypothetical protein